MSDMETAIRDDALEYRELCSETGAINRGQTPSGIDYPHFEALKEAQKLQKSGCKVVFLCTREDLGCNLYSKKEGAFKCKYEQIDSLGNAFCTSLVAQSQQLDAELNRIINRKSAGELKKVSERKGNKMSMEIRLTQMTVVPEGKEIFDAGAFYVSIIDDAGGEFLSVKCNDDQCGAGEIRIDKQEWEKLSIAISNMIKECR